MASSILSDNGVTSGSAGLKTSADSTGVLALQTTTAGGTATTAITVDTSQNVGIGTSSPSFKLDVQSAASISAQIKNTSGSGYAQWKALSPITTTNFGTDSNGGYMETIGAYSNLFYTNGTERMRITSGGYLKASNTGTYQSSSSSNHELRTNNGSDFSTYITNSNASTPYGLEIQFTGAAPNNTSQSFCLAEDTANLRFVIMSNGGIKNYQGNNVNLSDRREKTNFAPAKSYLNTICSIPVQTFNYIDQNLEEDDGLTLGVVAQDVQAVAPELVHETDWGTKEEPKMRLSIYQTDLQYALMKSIQELKAINDTQAETLTQQTEVINALTARVVALESK